MSLFHSLQSLTLKSITVLEQEEAITPNLRPMSSHK